MMTSPSQPILRGELRFDESLKRYNSWRVGGAARQLYLPADSDDLAAFLRTLPSDEPLLWLGLGSNLLIRDGGFRGTVIVLQGRLNELQISDSEVLVDAGVACAKVARACARAGLAGAAFLAGLATGFWPNRDEVHRAWQVDRTFEPLMSADEATHRRNRWTEALRRATDWEEH